MLKKILTILTAGSLVLTGGINYSFAAVKAGASCSKLGSTAISAGKKFTCVKSGKKLVWDKGMSVNKFASIDTKKTYSTDDGYYDNIIGGPLASDPRLPAEWAETQRFYEQNNRQSGQFRIAKYNLGSQRPKNLFQSSTEFSQVDSCKISLSRDRTGLSHFPDNYRAERKHPGPNSVIQLIPIYGEDTTKPSASPAQDYSKYLNFIKEWIDYSSDFGSNAQIRIPNEYIKFPNKIEPYKLYHPVNFDTPGHVRFNKDVVSAVDQFIDFSGAKIGIVVAPPGTDATVMQQAALGSFQTSEGLVPVAMSQVSSLPTNMNKSEYSILGHPFWWIHELYHAGYGFDDRYGDPKNLTGKGEFGMGWWTMMTPWGGDLSVWEKWLMGFVQDSQIQCVVNPKISTHWIAPASVKTQESKAIVIPISSTKAVVAESIRPAGLHYKTPQNVQGVLVYEIDLSKTEHGMGMKLSLPTNRELDSNPFKYGFYLGDAPLRNGDKTVSNGYEISVIESGNFGDVIKIQKI